LLDSLRISLHLDEDIAEAIEVEVLRPFQEYRRKVQEYEETLRAALKAEPELSQRTLEDLKDYQQHLGLRDEDVVSHHPGSPIQDDSADVKPRIFDFEVLTVNAKGQEINRKPGQAEYCFKKLGNGGTLDMVAIPGGTFQIGADESENGQPIHAMTITPFWMGKFPVTRKQYEGVMGVNPSRFQGKNLPVEKVSWHDAV
jgi:formylglycine-generating enzyme required for sulfatase activity